MNWYAYGPLAGLDPKTNVAVRDVDGTLHPLLSDGTVDLGQILAPTDMAGIPLSGGLVHIGSAFTTQQFRVEDQKRCMWVSGDYQILLISSDAAIAGAEAVETADEALSVANTAASSASDAQASAVRSADAAAASAAAAAATSTTAIDDHLGGDATDLVDRVVDLEARPIGGGGGGGQTWTVQKVDGKWPTSWDGNNHPVYGAGSAMRPTADPYTTVQWKGPDPAPPSVESGTGGMLNNVDLRFWQPA